MYAPRVSPIRRMRNSSSSGSTVDPLHPSPRRKGSVLQGTGTPRMNGDYQVLKQSVEEQRLAVRQARVALASSLDRLGEHHVRQKEYDDAMDAFAEALHEKRSVFSNFLSSPLNGEGSFSRTSSLSSSVFDTDLNDEAEVHDNKVDEIVLTLRNMGNVHSLRGEQDEAMRYYTEVTNLRATKLKKLPEDGTISGESRSLFSGLNGGEDNSTLMSEINEDVKALDDLFRSISFRTGDGSNLGMEKRKSTPLSPNSESRASSNKRRKGDSLPGSDALENEPFKRSTSICMSVVPETGSDLNEALEMFRTVLDSYQGTNLEQHKEVYNSFKLRADLLCENRKQPMPSPSSGGSKKDGQQGDASDLELSVEIYQEIMSIQKEMSSKIENDLNLSANSASTLIRLGSVYYKLGNRVEELQMYRDAKAVYKNAFGENHTFVAGARKNIGMVLAERGEYEGAMEEFEKARRIYLAVNDGDEMNRDVASAVSCMGNVKNRVGELDEALTHYMKALSIYKSIQDNSMDRSEGTANAAEFANAMRDVTSTLKVIGMVHAKKGELDTAMGFFKEAMSLLRSNGVDGTTIGRETIASVLTRMASIHVKKNDLDQAMDHYREAYELTIRNRGSTNHQDIAGILHYIGGIHHKRGDYDEAMNCYQEAIRIYHTTLGPGNPTVAGTLVMVGSIHYKRRNLDSAMMFYREALRLNRDAYGLHHPDVAPILKSIGTIMTKKGEYEEAYDIFRDVLSIKCTVHGTGHPEVASAYKSLGNVHYKMGELADAERQYRHALSIYRRTKGEDHSDTVAARTTIEHLRYWMKERGKRKLEQRHARSSNRSRTEEDERSC
ncbi:Kinesin light chain [Seminavis robusta]|uniref:Kinesin light chain n=1 Tax=Seminavis robusta TaxID=568900 RepID=A0A9N8HFJ8_9STRA|nr:Kinesin light chain [Seminavis robusta]|eukprot:Sro353_g124430.1 Kinesin light chain (836) ;mRNA; f:13507-16014